VLLCLARSWYVKASKEQSFTSMTVALQFTQKVRSKCYAIFSRGKLLISARTIFLSSAIQALHLQPVDKAVVYNIAMIQQKSAKLLFSLQPGKARSDLECGIARAMHAQKMFGLLVADPASAVPYDRDLAEERKKYADSMVRRAEEHLSAQRQHEAEQVARLEGARQKCATGRERVEALEVRSCVLVRLALIYRHVADVVDSANARHS